MTGLVPLRVQRITVISLALERASSEVPFLEPPHPSFQIMRASPTT